MHTQILLRKVGVFLLHSTSTIPALLGLGAFGFLGLTVLCPLVALPGYYFRRRNPASGADPEPGRPSVPRLIDIIVPAHNEAARIAATLESIQRSIQHLQASSPDFSVPKIRVHVAADGCSDQTPRIARQFPMVSVTESRENRSKWITLKERFASTTADWLILVDAGVLWPERFLSDVVQRISREQNAMAIAPSYRPLKAGWLARVLWRLETSLKRIEGFCGGPVSVHGATVVYKTPLLKKALALLGDTLWVNDDVVIPLTLRALYPEGVILYPVGEIQDAGVRQEAMDLGRRKRILSGNLQWARALWPACFRLNPVAGTVAMRRLFRILWAYWLAFIVLGLALAFHGVVLPAAAAVGILLALSGSVRQFAGAALVSLLAPFRLIRSQEPIGGSWL